MPGAMQYHRALLGAQRLITGSETGVVREVGENLFAGHIRTTSYVFGLNELFLLCLTKKGGTHLPSCRL